MTPFEEWFAAELVRLKVISVFNRHFAVMAEDLMHRAWNAGYEFACSECSHRSADQVYCKHGTLESEHCDMCKRPDGGYR